MTNESRTSVSRRGLLTGAVSVGAAALLGAPTLARAAEDKAVLKGRIKQSLCYWCLNVDGEKWDLEKICQVAKELGVPSVELCDASMFPTLKKHNLVCAMTNCGMPGAPFVRGLNQKKFHDEIVTTTCKTIDACAEAGMPSTICFTGFKWKDPTDPKSGEIDRDECFNNCVKGMKRLAQHAELKGVNVCLEMLNSRDGTHPMKGHPGYQGDCMDYCADMIKAVGSKRIKLLFDCYHVQIMNGDVMRRIGQYKDLIAHIHVAGSPGRNEMDENQEMNYPPIMRKLIEVGYTGYVGLEYLPTRNTMEGLRQAVKLLDV
ncbi:MAG TPA: TIM barrel protein [Planctomycetota bacterium]|jgi:hydroxypyruvate isomerase